jgi:D-alanyl-D-alanine carboxypeptidase (penicillin-binding protein 5/6)
MKTHKRHGGKRWLYVVAAIVVLAGYSYWALARALPPLSPVLATTQLESQTAASKLAWPSVGQSAVGIVGSPILEIHGPQTPAPTASTAKLITSLSVLHEKPLAAGEQGPTITLNASDVAIYRSYVAQEGSVVQVTAGEQISEYQMLEAMLLPSANNMADSLAIWAFGSLPAYTSFANNYVKQLGLTGTHIGSDASGFAPSTVSTAHDLVKVGELAMQNPVLAQIVGQSAATGIPVAKTIKNVNSLLGTANIVGVKTGNTNQAGGVFISASRPTINGKPVTVVTALVGVPTLFAALEDSLPFVQSAQANFEPLSIVTDGIVVGRYAQPWGGTLAAVTGDNLATTAWNDTAISSTVHLQRVSANTQAGQTVGSVTTPKSAFSDQQSVSVDLQTAPTQPSAWWRLLHP